MGGLWLMVLQVFDKIIDFDDGQADNPEIPSDGSRYTIGNVLKNPKLVSQAPKLDILVLGDAARDLTQKHRKPPSQKKTKKTENTSPKSSKPKPLSQSPQHTPTPNAT